MEMIITVETKVFKIASKSGGSVTPLGGVINDDIFSMLSNLQFDKWFIEFLDHGNHEFLVCP
jgi:hypothetical protein